jgi:hypothetical protein
MPARIWATDEGQPYGVWGVSHDEGDTLYIRADIAEQMAEALQRCAAALQVLPNSERDIIKFTGKWERYGSMRVSDILDRAESALSAWEASNPDRQAAGGRV